MVRFNAIVDAVLFYLVTGAFAIILGICLVQVVARYLFGASFTWAEEVSIVLLLYATWGAACLGVKEGVHLRLSILDGRITSRGTIILRLALNCLAISLMVAIALMSEIVMRNMADLTLMSLPSVPLNVVYACIPIGCIMMIYYLSRAVAYDLGTLRSLSWQHAG